MNPYSWTVLTGHTVWVHTRKHFRRVSMIVYGTEGHMQGIASSIVSSGETENVLVTPGEMSV